MLTEPCKLRARDDRYQRASKISMHEAYFRQIAKTIALIVDERIHLHYCDSSVTVLSHEIVLTYG